MPESLPESVARTPDSSRQSPPAPRRKWAPPLAVFGIETVAILFSAALAFLLRFDFRIPAAYVRVLALACIVWVPVKLISFKLHGLDRRWARYVSLADLLRLALSNLIATCVALAILLVIGAGVPKSVYAIDFLLCLMVTASVRISVRVVSESRNTRPASIRKRTIVYGAGNAGASLLRDLRQNAGLNYDVCGFVDDNPHKLGLVLQGVKVLGNGGALEEVARKSGAELVLIAIPSATGHQMTEILERCATAGLPYKTIPSLAEIMDGSALARQIRDVAVEDLLGRNPVKLEQERIAARLNGRVVLVTGAAGSIGSEICRQIARFKPAAIIGFEIAESPLFHLGLEMARDFPDCVFHQEIGSIQNAARLKEVFARHRPSVVYHAAAYKHVPLMEAHIFEAVENNVFGTMNVVEAARTGGVSEFVMISSDKAVRPSSVMGATKRLAEVLVRSCQPESGVYVSVRFGNVLGSNGSVVPIFKDQIARGGPITITHPEMRRYFMTIQEACQLVLQASTMGKGSEIFVLNMGAPVRIADLARNLILLSGLRPEHDIRMVYTGTRPGEKLYEELRGAGEDLVPTRHEKISVFTGSSKSWSEMEESLQKMRACCAARDEEKLSAILRALVPDYTCQPTGNPDRESLTR